MWQFLIFIMFILLLQKFSKNLEEQRKQQEEETKEEKIGDLFQTLGFPLPEETPPRPEWKMPKEPAIVKKEIKRPEAEIAELKPEKIETPIKQIEEAEEELPTFSEDKLQEGIILSEILGPPKAYQIRRGGGIGIRAGLKNR